VKLHLNTEQRGVVTGMAAALFIALALLSIAAVTGVNRIAPSVSVEFRLNVLAASLMLPAFSLFICIARLAKHRFFSAEDINGSALTAGSSRAKLLQALLQNTLEQVVLILCVYSACAFSLPSQLLGLIPTAAIMFLVGRLLFYVGYAGGAHARAFGFALTFYPTVFLGFIAFYCLAFHNVA